MTDSNAFKQWYFEEGGEPVGSLSFGELHEALKAGRIHAVAPQTGNIDKGEGFLLGRLDGMGDHLP